MSSYSACSNLTPYILLESTPYAVVAFRSIIEGRRLKLKTTFFWTLFCTCVCLLFSASITTTSVLAQDAVYNPGDVGAPTRRSGAGTRSAGKLPALNVITPEHTGLVINAQPTLYWAIDKTPNSPVMFSLRPSPLFAPPNTKPFVQKEMLVESSGIHAVNLRDTDYKLDPEVEYEWSVTLSAYPNVIASGTIMRTQPKPEVLKQINRIAKQHPLSLPGVYAQYGYWYDAIEALSVLIDKNPKNDTLRANRIALLEQVKLPNVAKFDKVLLSSNTTTKTVTPPTPAATPTVTTTEPEAGTTSNFKMKMVTDEKSVGASTTPTTESAPATTTVRGIKMNLVKDKSADMVQTDATTTVTTAQPKQNGVESNKSVTAPEKTVDTTTPPAASTQGIKMEMLKKEEKE